MKRSFFRTIVVFMSVLLPAGAFAASFSVGSVGPVPTLTPNFGNIYGGQYPGVGVRVWLYPAGMKTPPNAKLIFGQLGSTRYAMLLNLDSSSERAVDPLGVDPDENLRSDFELQRTMSRKLLRIVVDSRQDKRLEGELIGADQPIEFEGRVSGSASPILTVLQIAEPTASEGASSAMHLTNPVASRSSELKPN